MKLFIKLNMVLLFLFTSVLATNGYLSHGVGAKSKSMAGVVAAFPLDGFSAFSNPALITDVEDSLDIGLALFKPTRSYTSKSDGATFPIGNTKSDKESFLIPQFSYNHHIDSSSTLTFLLISRGGMNTRYNSDTFSPFNSPAGTASSPTGVDLAQIFLSVAYAYKINKKHSIGFMPIFAVQRFRAYGLEPFRGVSAFPNFVTNNGYDKSYGGGFQLGYFAKMTDNFNFGISYASRIWMSRFDKYKGLFADQGDFDIPPMLNFGFSYTLSDITLALDYQRIYYGDIASINNSNNVPLGSPTTLLGTKNGAGFGWQDIDIFKFGLAWKVNEDWILRTGYSHASQVIPDDEILFNLIAPGVIRDHFTAGFSRNISNNQEINLAFSYMPDEEICGKNINTGTQTNCINMHQVELEMSWGLKF